MRVRLRGSRFLVFLLLSLCCNVKSTPRQQKADQSPGKVLDRIQALFAKIPNVAFEKIEPRRPQNSVRLHGLSLSLSRLPASVRLKGVCVRMEMGAYRVNLLPLLEHSWGEGLDDLLKVLSVKCLTETELSAMSGEDLAAYHKRVLLRGLLPWRRIFVSTLDSHTCVWGSAGPTKWHGIMFAKNGTNAVELQVFFQEPPATDHGDSVFRDIIRESRLDLAPKVTGKTLLDSAKAELERLGSSVTDERP